MSEANVSLASTNHSTVAVADKTELLRLLDVEINHIFDKQRSQGWTTWALVVGLATIGWMLLEKLESGSYSWSNVLTIILIGGVFSISADFLVFALWPPNAQHRSTRFRYYDSYSLLTTALLLLYSLALVIIAIAQTPNVSLLKVSYVVIFLSTVILTSIGVFLARYFRIPMEFSREPLRRPVKIGFTIAALAAIYCVLGYARNLAEATFDDWRVALFFLVIAELMTRLTKPMKDAPTVEALIAIRRDLVLGRIDLIAATRQAEIVFMGMRVSDVLQDEIREYLDVITRNNAQLDEALTKLAAVEVDLPPGDSLLLQDKGMVLKTVLDACDRDYKECMKRGETILAKWRKIDSRMSWMWSPATSRDIVDVRKQIADGFQTVLERWKKYGSKASILRKRLPKGSYPHQ
jgi:hypothetical protein